MSSTSAEPHADDESCQRPVHIRGACTGPILQNSLGGGIEDIKLPAIIHDYLYIHVFGKFECNRISRLGSPSEISDQWLILRGVTTLL